MLINPKRKKGNNETRRKMRILAIANASELIESHLQFGITPNELGLTEEEFIILEEENEVLSKRILKMAKSLIRESDYLLDDVNEIDKN